MPTSRRLPTNPLILTFPTVGSVIRLRILSRVFLRAVRPAGARSAARGYQGTPPNRQRSAEQLRAAELVSGLLIELVDQSCTAAAAARADQLSDNARRIAPFFSAENPRAAQRAADGSTGGGWSAVGERLTFAGGLADASRMQRATHAPPVELHALQGAPLMLISGCCFAAATSGAAPAQLTSGRAAGQP